MELTVGAVREPPVEALEVEVVERKGLGHPDSICDRLAEQLSSSLSRHYLDRFGLVLHHNVDKALLWAGSARPAFGGGEVVEPIEVYLAGRAVRQFQGIEVPVEELTVEGSRDWLRRNLRGLDPDHHVRIHCLVRPGSADLADLFLRETSPGMRLSNDTSIGVGFAPLTELERVVAEVEARLNSSEVKESCPEVGEDIKVMGVRHGDRIRLTVSCAFVGKYLANGSDYLEKKERAKQTALEASRRVAQREVSIELNTADDPTQGKLYLTVTGTSAESGDDGQAGRGNRANGLITPYRPMTLESAAGKNPVTHVGKLYPIVAQRIAEELIEEIPEVTAAECCLVSQIGRAIADPQLADVTLRLDDGRRPALFTREVETIVRGQLSRLDEIGREILEGRIMLC
jgi:S-adenosylmethionine synthetase